MDTNISSVEKFFINLSDFKKKLNQKQCNEIMKIKKEKNSDFGLTDKKKWNLKLDKFSIEEEQTLQIAKCTQILSTEYNNLKVIVHIKHTGKFLVSLGDRVSPTDLSAGVRVGIDRSKYQIQMTLPVKIDPQVSMMAVEEKPDMTYSDIGGCKEQILEIREIVEYPLLYPKRYSSMGIDPPKGAMLFGPPGTGKTLVARAVANRTDACFIRVICSELVQKYIGEGARMVRELFGLARRKNACIIFFDELDAIGGTRFDDGIGGDNEVQRTMLEIVNQLDGFEPRGNIKILMATNRPDTIDPALMRPGRLDRKIEFGLPELDGRVRILKIHAKRMKYDECLRFELLARLCNNCTGADLRSICTEAGMFAIRRNHDYVTEEDFLCAVNKVVKTYSRFNATPKYLMYN